MTEKTTAKPSVCVLTQTATELPAYYRKFFHGFDLFFVTFKQKNSEAVDFLPGSTWSDGRNRLWEHVRGRYDYYLFVDDDLEFLSLPRNVPLSFAPLLEKKIHLQERLHIRRVVSRAFRALSYQQADPVRFRELLFEKLRDYQPMVASFARTTEQPRVSVLDRYSLARNRRVRPLGWFDAQVTLFSETGGRLLLPYDTSISGWWSSQIPIYVLGHLAFQDRAMCFLDLATQNTNRSVYRPGYDGASDCLTMARWLTPGILSSNCDPIEMEDGRFIDFEFGRDLTKTKVALDKSGDRTLETALFTLGESFDLHHPYLYARHKALIDAWDEKVNKDVAEKRHG